MQRITPILLPALLLSLAAQAEPAKLLARHGDWEAYSYGGGASKVCYAASQVKTYAGDVAGRKAAYVMVTHGPGKSANVASITMGYVLKEGSEVEAALGQLKVRYYSKDDTAWARSADEPKFIAALQKEKTLTVKGEPAKGKPTTDTYSLAGFPEAYKEIGKACGVK